MQKPADNPLERLRSLCLAFPETVEIEAWGHPNFRAGKRTFAAFEWWRGRPGIAVRVDPFDQADLLQSGRFFAPPHGQGRWLAVWADEELDWALLEELLETSYRSVALARMIRALDARPGDGSATQEEIAGETRKRRRTDVSDDKSPRLRR
jgi:predicted DNA-binding protein (MmcQ/YjbR family)